MAVFGQVGTMGMVNLDWVTSTMRHQQKFKIFPKCAVFQQDITTLCCWTRTEKSGHADTTCTANLEGHLNFKKTGLQMLLKSLRQFDLKPFQQVSCIQCFWTLRAEFGDVDTTVMHPWLFPTPELSQMWRNGEKIRKLRTFLLDLTEVCL